jgi:hypothetical protein
MGGACGGDDGGSSGEDAGPSACDDGICDRDGDGVPADREVGGRPDCDDSNPAVSPLADEDACGLDGGDGLDNDCNGYVDERCASGDLDGDGADFCTGAPGEGACDCNDCDPGIGPGNMDACGTPIDEDCAPGPPSCEAQDMDADGFAGAPGPDCNDADPRTFPGAPENCATPAEESCGGILDCAGADADGDGFAEPAACENDATHVPVAVEACNGIDDDCDGRVDEMLLAPEPGFPQSRTGCAVGRPIDMTTDLFNCGGCRNICNPSGLRAADRCVDGVCLCAGVSACGGGPEDSCCSDGCVNTLTDVRHCGNCEAPCMPPATACVDGACT